MIAPAMPAIGGNGLAMRLGVFLEALARAGDTELIVVPIAGRADESPTLAEHWGVRCHVLNTDGRQDTHLSLLLRLADPVERLAAFRGYGKPSLSGWLSAPLLAEMRALIETGSFDLVHVARLYLADAALPGPPGQVRTVDIDDDDAAAYSAQSAIMRRDARTDAANWAKAEAGAFAALARRTLPHYDRVFAADSCATQRRVEIVPNSVSFPKRPDRIDDGRTLLFVGSLGYEPNVDGLLWFARNVWPLVRRAAPALRLAIVGRNAPRALDALHGRQGISVNGTVDDLNEVYSRAMLSIAPLRSGGGTRIKLIEAASRKVPFVATSVASAGLAIGNDRCGWIADDAAGFAHAVFAARTDRSERVRRAARAYSVARRLYDRELVVRRLAETFAALSDARGG